VFLQFAGWIFNSVQAAEAYSFIVFLMNKIAAIVLLPFLLLLAFSDAPLSHYTAIVAGFVVAVLFLYRFLVSLRSIKQDLKVGPLHFFIFLVGVEILPLLLIYKGLVSFYYNRTL
jgi:hypothetical protein